MSQLIGWLLFISLWTASPANGHQKYVFVPMAALDWIKLPVTDYGGTLLTERLYCDVTGLEADVKYFTCCSPECDPDVTENRPMILALFIATNRIDAKKLSRTISRINSGSDPTKRRIIFLKLGEEAP